jgi:hypothetical protein
MVVGGSVGAGVFLVMFGRCLGRGPCCCCRAGQSRRCCGGAGSHGRGSGKEAYELMCRRHFRFVDDAAPVSVVGH